MAEDIKPDDVVEMASEPIENIAPDDILETLSEPNEETADDEENLPHVSSDEQTDGSANAEPHGVFIKQEKTDKPHWYVIHTYSGYENKVKVNLDKAVVNRGFEDVILEVKVPMDETIEVKNGKKKHVMKKMYPGYVMVKMILDDETWYVVRNTRGVTGFVGPGSKPIPLTDKEVRTMGIEDVQIKLDIEVGENVMVTSGPLESFIGVVKEVHPEKQKVKVVVSMFGRDTIVDLDFVQIKRL